MTRRNRQLSTVAYHRIRALYHGYGEGYYTQTDLAQRTGVSRRTVGRIVKRLREQGR